MFNTLFTTQVTLSVAMAVVAVIIALHRPASALFAFATALAADADALTMPGHRSVWGAWALLACAAALLIAGVVVAVRRKRPQHNPATRPGCSTDASSRRHDADEVRGA